jgi:hypothetical protein
MILGSLAVLNFSARAGGAPTPVLAVAQASGNHNWAGWDGNRTIYLTDYTGYTYPSSLLNSSSRYQTTSNSSFTAQNMPLANAETVSVNTGQGALYPSVLPPYSFYTYSVANGFELMMNVTNSGTTTPVESYNGGWFWAYSQFENMSAILSHGPLGTVQTSIVSAFDDGINISSSGNYIVSTGSQGGEIEAAGIAAGLSALAAIVDVATAGAGLVALPAEAAAIYDAYHFAQEAGEYSSSSYTSSISASTGNATVNQWSEISSPIPHDYEFSQSTRLTVDIWPNSNGVLPRLADGPAELQLAAGQQLGDNRSGPGNWQDSVDGATPILMYWIYPGVSIQGNVYLDPGVVAPGATVLLAMSCPSGSPTLSSNYYETANSAGHWHFFAYPGCTYTYSASAPDGPQGQTLTSPTTTFTLPASSAGSNLTIAPLTIAYPVTFSETGAPSGSTWSVTMNGATLGASAGSNIVFEEPNGTYSYSVTAPSGYTASGGSVTVNGKGISQSITISKLTTYSVSFKESGLPSGDTWSATISTTKSASAGSTITFSGLSGSNSYSVGTVIVSASGCVIVYYAPSPASGTVTGSTTISVTYTYHVSSEPVNRCISKPAAGPGAEGAGVVGAAWLAKWTGPPDAVVLVWRT